MSLRILIVEDDCHTRRALALLFTELGFAPIEASNAQQALKLLNDGIDVVCLDLMLADYNGVEVLRRLRADKLRTKVAIISGANEPNVLAEVTALKPDAIFGKPIDINDLLSWLKSACVSKSCKVRARNEQRVAASA